MKNIRLVATDLDGTFLKNDRTISQSNIDALHRLGEKKIVRVAATGRNLMKVKEVLYPDLPFDYVVFSSGAGVYNWKEKTHMASQNIKKTSAQKLLHYFTSNDINFHAFYPVPENHKHYYYRGANDCEEFERYFKFNAAHAEPLQKTAFPQGELCQFLIIIRQNEERFAFMKSEIEALCPEIRVIRASSPITPGFIWIEVFHHSVSKGNGVNKICKQLGISKNETMGLGNDYNDFDLLEYTMHSFLTENSPNEIKGKYPVVPSNENDAFAFSVQVLLS
ncbi:HAD family hydrolase [uncultured Draconibacterium sp.]|uniref:HAD family hydrolase n=1 Tax=uncultured Draconibacterium sp. TaxID=1573823 RepID=UPI003261B94B